VSPPYSPIVLRVRNVRKIPSLTKKVNHDRQGVVNKLISLFSFQRETCLDMPHHASPCLTMPHHTSPCLNMLKHEDMGRVEKRFY
jgi:hypothetical protein